MADAVAFFLYDDLGDFHSANLFCFYHQLDYIETQILGFHTIVLYTYEQVATLMDYNVQQGILYTLYIVV